MMWTAASQGLMLIVAILSPTTYTAFGFQSTHNSLVPKQKSWHNMRQSMQTSLTSWHNHHPSISNTELNMVRNIDLPEAIVFYGIESMMEPLISPSSESGGSNGDQIIECTLRPGVVRLLTECQEVGTAALLLSEHMENEDDVKDLFEKAWKQTSSDGSSSGNAKLLEEVLKSDGPVLSFRCLQSQFTIPSSPTNEEDEITAAASSEDDELYDDESIELYNLGTYAKSPSPAFLLDSLQSIHIDPRGFGGSSGFGRGQWIEPRRSPMCARAVVFIAGDWIDDNGSAVFSGNDDVERGTVTDRCAAARASGCRVIYLEHLPEQQELKYAVEIQDDTQTMSLCDAVISTYGNDNVRDLNQVISLDAISTPGDYWLNPPTPRDDMGNRVDANEIVEFFKSEWEMEEVLGDAECEVPLEEEEAMSEDEMAKILADLDGL